MKNFICISRHLSMVILLQITSRFFRYPNSSPSLRRVVFRSLCIISILYYMVFSPPWNLYCFLFKWSTSPWLLFYSLAFCFSAWSFISGMIFSNSMVTPKGFQIDSSDQNSNFPKHLLPKSGWPFSKQCFPP